MDDILAEYEDEHGNEYVLFDGPDDSDDEPRNARVRDNRRRRRSPGRMARRERRRPYPPPAHQPAPQPHVSQPHAQRSPEQITIKTKKVLQFVEVVADGMAELVPLPEQPPRPVGDVETDLQNQNEHRHALHSHRVLTNRIRTGGRVLSRVFELLLD